MNDSIDRVTDKRLDEIERRCRAATGGTWISHIEGRDHTSGPNFIMTGEGACRGDDIELSGASIADQEFIAHARQDIPDLLAEIHRLRDVAV